MKPKDAAREWLDTRCGRAVHVETHLVNGSTTPVVNHGALTKGHTAPTAGGADVRGGAAPVPDLYQVGSISYNLADLPENIEVHIRAEPAELLEMTFDDGTSMLITVVITVMKEDQE